MSSLFNFQIILTGPTCLTGGPKLYGCTLTFFEQHKPKTKIQKLNNAIIRLQLR
jgi:hypothetical protein